MIQERVDNKSADAQRSFSRECGKCGNASQQFLGKSKLGSENPRAGPMHPCHCHVRTLTLWRASGSLKVDLAEIKVSPGKIPRPGLKNQLEALDKGLNSNVTVNLLWLTVTMAVPLSRRSTLRRHCVSHHIYHRTGSWLQCILRPV